MFKIFRKIRFLPRIKRQYIFRAEISRYIKEFEYTKNVYKIEDKQPQSTYRNRSV